MGKPRRLTGGALIAAKLDDFGWTRSRLAELLGVESSTVTRWISGEREPSLPLGLELAKVLGIEPADLVVKRTGTDG